MKNNRKNRKRIKMVLKRNPKGCVIDGAHVLLDPLVVDGKEPSVATINALSALVRLAKKIKI